jgi:hypothetical protein
MRAVTIGIEGDVAKEYRLPRRCTPQDVLDTAGIGSTGVRAVRQYLADGIRQRYWPLSWNEVFDGGVEDGDRFEIEYGSAVEQRPARGGYF